ncbi:hypothetical protein TL16_g12369 [Triparma laevis f. inornata]|uniref:glucose-6-phosphate 1-epimerase n=2 Tax=Triparma laevis TaxID=1534972 RepID=A0A9W7L063_9STRA|nr:hypothetical protein TL16_g12369 [Triparma laevis f. inornata]GMI17749.1 hypothetical protein TrLO_g14851 [Triparma laevis f. longispina]
MSKSIRGGVPICFPQFGRTSDKTSPQHGWARLNTWTLNSQTSTSVSMSISSTSPSTTAGRPIDGHWPPNSTCPYSTDLNLTVSLTDSGDLSYSLKIINNLETTAPFQCLLHNYYNFSFDDGKITGLENYECIDTQPRGSEGKGMAYFTQGPEPIELDGEVDRIFHPPSGKDNLEIQLNSSAISLKTVIITCSASSSTSSSIPLSTVVWNPYIKKAKEMGDFDDDGYKSMVCVEPGIINGLRILKPKEEVTISKTIHVE